jgi:hypothetical protein
MTALSLRTKTMTNLTRLLTALCLALALGCATLTRPPAQDAATDQLVDEISDLEPAPESCGACLDHVQQRDGLLSRCAVQLRSLQDELRAAKEWGEAQERAKLEAEERAQANAEAAGRWYGLQWTLWAGAALLVLAAVGYVVVKVRKLAPG